VGNIGQKVEKNKQKGWKLPNGRQSGIGKHYLDRMIIMGRQSD